MTKLIQFVIINILWIYNISNLHSQNAIVLNQKSDITLTGNKLTKRICFQIQINNPNGDEYCTISLPYNKQLKVNNITAQITDLHGNVVSQLKKTDIKKKSMENDFAFYSDLMVYEFTLQHFNYPYILSYSYNVEQTEFLDIHNWHPLIDYEIETKSAELTFTADSNYKFSFDAHLIQPPTKNTNENKVSYQWKAYHKACKPLQHHMSNIEEYLPSLRIVPTSFKYLNTGSFNSWKSYGDWQYDINSSLQTIPLSKQIEIRNIADQHTDTLNKIKALYHWLQDETRYVNISLNKGGMIPTDAAIVSECKYGDCKGLTNYFRAVLNCIGIQSNYSDINAGEEITKINTNFPAQQFNHVILTIPIKEDTIWLDCTSKGPFGYVGTFIQNRPLLIIERSNSRISRTPSLNEQDVESKRSFQIKLDSTLTNTITAHCTYKGNEFETLHFYKKLPKVEQRQAILNSFTPKNSDIDTHEIIHTNRDSTHIILTYTGSSNQYIQNTANELSIYPIPFTIPYFEKPSQRNYPVSFAYPIKISDNQFFEFNTAKLFNIRIPEISIISEFGSYKKTFELKKGGIEIKKMISINPGAYSHTKYSEFYDFISKVKNEESNSLILKYY